MSLINPSVQAPELSVAELQVQLKARTANQMTVTFKNLVATFNELFKGIWENPSLAPQQALDAFGGDAAELFKIAEAFQVAINVAVPQSLDLAPPVALTFNDDGTVLITPSVAAAEPVAPVEAQPAEVADTSAADVPVDSTPAA